MKTKFLAGLVASLISLLVVVGIAIFFVTVLDIDASKNVFTYSAAFVTIAVWLGIYNKLKPKETSND